MIPEAFITFFAASLTADGALIGLLFVAIAIEPKDIFGATPERALAANGAFTSLVNAFLISMLALVPGVNIGWATMIVAVLALLNTVIHTLDKLRRSQHAYSRSLAFTLGALILYGGEIFYGLQIVLQPSQSLSGLYALIYVLVAIYGVALTRAWSLLGGEDRSFRRLLVDALWRRRPDAQAAPEPSDEPAPDTR